jgi:hypothetical protein
MAVLATVALLFTAAVADAEVRSYRHALSTRSGDSHYAGAIDRSVAQGYRYDVETDASGRVVRVATFLNGTKTGEVFFRFSGDARLASGYDYFGATGEKSAKVEIHRNERGERIRQEYFSPQGSPSEHTVRTYAPDHVEAVNSTADGKRGDRYLHFYSPRGILVRSRWVPAAGTAHYDSEFDETTGLIRERRKYTAGDLSITETFSYDAVGLLRRNELFDPDGRRYAWREYTNGLKTRERYEFASGNTQEIVPSYDDKRQAKESKFYYNNRLICTFTYERLPNGRVTRSLAHGPGGDLMAEYPDVFVDKIERNGRALDRPTLGTIYKQGDWY